MHPRKHKRKTKLAIAALVLCCLFIAACFVAKLGYDLCFRRTGGAAAGTLAAAWPGDIIELEYFSLDAGDFPRRPITFSSGANRLQGYVYGTGTQKGLVVISHGIGAGARAYLPDTLYFVEQGWQVLAFDNTGHYASEGDSARGIVQSALDLDAALDYVQTDTTLQTLPVVLYGHSWGGYAVAAVLANHPEVRAAVSLAGFATPAIALYDFAENRTGIFGVLAYPLFWGYHCLLFGQNANRSAISSINATAAPVMVVHGTEDNTLRYDVSGIIAHHEQITNPGVVYITRSAAGQNGHGNLRFSPDAALRAAEKQAEWQALERTHGGLIPEAARAAYESGITVALAAGLDEAFFEEIIAFYSETTSESSP